MLAIEHLKQPDPPFIEDVHSTIQILRPKVLA